MEPHVFPDGARVRRRGRAAVLVATTALLGPLPLLAQAPAAPGADRADRAGRAAGVSREARVLALLHRIPTDHGQLPATAVATATNTHVKGRANGTTSGSGKRDHPHDRLAPRAA